MNLFNQYKGLRREIYILFIGRIVTSLGSMVYPVMTLILNQKLGLSSKYVAIIEVISFVIAFPAGIIGGKIADKLNKKRVIVYCDCISILLYILCAFIPLSYWTVGIMMIAGIFQSIEYPSYDTLIADLTLTKDRERAYSLQYLGMNLGLVASPTIAGVLFKNYLWLSFLISGVAIGISTFLIFTLIKDVTPVKDESEAGVYQNSRSDASLWEVIRDNKLIVFYLVIMALYWCAYNQYGFIMPLDLAKIHGDNGALIFGTVSSINCIVVVIFTPIFTKIFAKLTHTRMNFLGQLLVLVGYGVFLVFIGRIPVYYVAIILFTFGEILTTISNGPYISSRIPLSHRGRINGFANVLQGILSGIMLLSIGTMYDELGSVITWVFILCILGLAIIGSFLLIILDKKHYKALYVSK